jgi:hypothetical protein
MKILLLFLFFGLSLFASIGKISALNGKVIVDRQSKLLDADVGFNLEEKDFILTDEKSKAQITLNDGTVLSIGKNSKLNINEYVFDEKDSSNSKAEFKFVEGTFKSITGAIGKVAPEKFKLETKSASIGIRGTIVVGNQDKVACTHGQIAVTSGGVTQILNAGYRIDDQFSINSSISFSNVDYNDMNSLFGTKRSDNIYGFLLGVGYSFNKDLAFGLTYNYINQDSNQAPSEYDKNTIKSSIYYTF